MAFDFMPSLRRCPWSQIDPETMMMVSWFTDWRDYKILPFGGASLSEEPAFVYAVIHHASTVIREIETERAKKQRAELDRSMKKGRRHG